jgi:hypothetical protein
MITVRTNFDPRLHGFKFINRFELPGLANLSLPGLNSSPFSLGNMVYGLCGGMCFSALDYFHAGRPVPDFASEEDVSLRLYNYLLTRQLNSLAGGSLLKVIAWMAMDDSDLVTKMVQSEIPNLTAALAGGNPAVLVLIRVHGLTDPTHNHQVTAIGYDLDPDNNSMTIHLYDPNHPGEEPTLTMNLSRPKKGIKLTQSTGEALRGFFMSEYQPQVPA